uniref:Uncharacterized protein n=1 Tax=Solanum tuberosum TaxID=4113 RepID=M1B9K0_SOLTU
MWNLRHRFCSTTSEFPSRQCSESFLPFVSWQEDSVLLCTTNYPMSSSYAYLLNPTKWSTLFHKKSVFSSEVTNNIPSVIPQVRFREGRVHCMHADLTPTS